MPISINNPSEILTSVYRNLNKQFNILCQKIVEALNIFAAKYDYKIQIALINFKVIDYMYYRLRNLREDKDMTQTQIAKLLNCSQRIYSNYERGDVDIPTHILIGLAKIHETSVDYLLELTDNKQPYERKPKL